MTSDAKTRSEARKLLRATTQAISENIGCYDGSCIYGSAGGMQTNGGCCCLKDQPREARKPMQVLSRAAAKLAEDVVILRAQLNMAIRDGSGEW